MKWILLSIIFFLFCFTGSGIHLFKKLQLNYNGYHAPYGMAFLLCILQLLYYPMQLLHTSFWLLFAITTLVLLYFVYCTIVEWKDVIKELKQWKSLWVVVGIAVFVSIFYFCYIDQEFSDSPMYLNYIAQNIGIDHLNLFNLYSGKVGAEWDALYLYQGYYHFVSCYVVYLNLPDTLLHLGKVETLKAIIWGMGMLYSMLGAMQIVNITNQFSYKRNWYRYVLCGFGLLYLGVYYWRIVFAFYGNTYRSFFITLLMITIYLYEKGELRGHSRQVLPMIGFAGMACSSSYLFASFAVLLIYAGYLFIEKREGSLYDMSIYIMPIAIYACIMISRSSVVGYLLSAFFIFYYLFARSTFIKKILQVVETFLIRYAKLIFYALIPGAFALLSLYIYFKHPDYLYLYSYYFNNHQAYDMVKDYFFIYSTWYDNIINILRWIGVVLVLKNFTQSQEQRYLRVNTILMLLLFMNPLCTPAISYTIASNVFYRAWEVLFNPFTELIILAYLLNQFQQKWVPIGLTICLVISTLVTNIKSFQGDHKAAYGFYIDGGKQVEHISKMETAALDAIEKLDTILQEEPLDHQPVIISQAEGTRVYLPQVYQMFTARDYFYEDVRVNQFLYHITRRHHPWDEPWDPWYEITCDLLQEYKTDYILLRYLENPEFDSWSNACTVTIYDNDTFKIKKVK